ncbi:hypothetical protein [Nonomuraea sp. NPDC049129]|uniref:DUF7178 family protein n=1 Tax=Nonomuraea sp. NPDC049129 TaxID=3155272 RepID=UPI003403E621
MLISINPDPETFQRYVRNVVAVWDSATSEQLNQGLHWYRSANQLAYMISDGHVRKGAGVIAALSANKRWSTNVALATRAFESGKPSGHFNDALDKADRIMAGEDPESVLPMDIKTGQFFKCIANPRDSWAVCIDRHAHDIAVGMRYGDSARGLSSRNRYAMLASVYRKAADWVGYLPQEIQAVTWVTWIESREN